jgi:hypothetical protein
MFELISTGYLLAVQTTSMLLQSAGQTIQASGQILAVYFQRLATRNNEKYGVDDDPVVSEKTWVN